MRPPHRSTRSTISPISPNSELRPRPTLADIQIAPRRRLRDGSTSSRGKSNSSRGTSVTSSSSSSRSRQSSISRSGLNDRRSNIMSVAGIRGRSRGRTRGESIASNSMISESDGGSFIPSLNDSLNNSTSTSRESSLTPPPPAPISNSRQRRNNQSIIDIMDEHDLSHNTQTPSAITIPDSPASPISYPTNPRRNGSSSNSNSSRSGNEIDQPISNRRRFTTAEKGKGRAVVSPIEISSTDESEDQGGDGEEEQGNQSIQFLNSTHKRRRESDEDLIDELITNNGGQVDSDEEEIDEESTLAGGYTCPVCFCPPSQAVMTPCGHILCAQCLHSSLLAAIGRNPNPYPDLHPHPHRGGRPGSRGRGARGGAGGVGVEGGGRSTRSNHIHQDPTQLSDISTTINRIKNIISMYSENGGPKSWTKELLLDFYYFHLNEVCERQLKKNDVDISKWNTIKQLQLPKFDEIKIEQKLKGLWRVEDFWVVEGECPVCRNPLPGGYGPPGTGIGGIIPLQARLSDPSPTSKRRW